MVTCCMCGTPTEKSMLIVTNAKGRVACETLLKTGYVMIAGEITTETYVHIPDVVRKVTREIGYTDPSLINANSYSGLIH